MIGLKGTDDWMLTFDLLIKIKTAQILHINPRIKNNFAKTLGGTRANSGSFLRFSSIMEEAIAHSDLIGV